MTSSGTVRARHVHVGNVTIGNDRPFALIAGPCQIESRSHAREMCHALVELTGKLGIGTVREEIRVDGSTSLAGPFPTVQTTGGGFYATGANSGKFTRDQFAVLSEFGTNLSVQVTPMLTVNFGYNSLYLTRVVRPGDQLSPTINSTLIPTGQNFGARFGPQTPGLPFATSSYWAQGFNFGFAVGY